MSLVIRLVPAAKYLRPPLRSEKRLLAQFATTAIGGWKDSGVGPPEHESADLEFCTRRQTVYRPES
jgi:hypothetical protein